MSLIFDIFKTIGGPGSLGFLAVATAIGLVFLYIWPKRRRLGRVWLLAVASVYFAMGMPLVANAIAARVPAYHPLPDMATLQGVDTLIVFDGDNRRGRVRESTRIWKAIGPSTVIVSGAPWLIDCLADEGVSPARLIIDLASETTREQVAMLDRLIDETRNRRRVLVASRLQMARVQALIRAVGVDAILAPSPVDAEPPTAGVRVFIPTYAALRVSRDALYEHAALAYYRWRGWISHSPNPLQPEDPGARGSGGPERRLCP